MHRRYFLILAIIAVFGSGLTILSAAATQLHPAAHWTQHQLAAFPDLSEQPVAVGLESLQALTLATADFDGDGVPDLLVGYARQDDGALVLHHGNIDCYRPNSPETLKHRSEGTWSDAPFLSPPRMFELSSKPEFLLAGDFNGDFKSDVVFGSKGESKLVLLPGDGHGSFEAEAYLELPGSITAVSSGEVGRRDGHEDLLVGIDTSSGPQLLLFQSMEGAFSADPAVLELPGLAEKIVVGQLVGDYLRDFAVAANEYLVIVEGRDELLEGNFDSSQIDEYSFSAVITDLVAGDFSGDHQEELAVLTSDGYLGFLQLADGSINEKNSVRVFNPSLVSSAKQLTLSCGRILTAGKDKLIALDSQSREVRLILPELDPETADLRAPLSRTLFPLVEPIAVLATRLNLDGLADLVFLNQNSGMLGVALTRPLGADWTVNDAGTQYDFKVGDGICDVDKSTEGDQCTFRAAIQEANADSFEDTITFAVGAQTLGTTVTQPVIINGNGKTLTLAPSGNSYLAIQGGDSIITGLTLQDLPFSISQKGNVQVLDNSFDRGIRIDGVSDVTISNNTIEGATGYGVYIVHGSGNVADLVGIVIDNNLITNCPMAGIRDGERTHNQGSTSLAVTNNTIHSNGEGVNAAGKSALIQGNFIGTELEAGNTKSGILLYGDSAQILNNKVKYNQEGGIWILGSAENTLTDNTFEGNSSAAVGFSGSNSFPNYNLVKKNTFVNNIGWGISHLNSDGLKVEENSFIGNYGGLDLDGRNALVRKNWIGISKEGEVLGNKKVGVTIWGTGNEVSDNTIAYNGTPPNSPGETGSYAKGYGSGVEIHYGATDNTVSQNRIFANVGASKDEVGYSQGLGIDIWGNGVTPNDSEENDGAQNYPELTLTGVGEVTVSLQSTPNSKFRIELFSNETCDETGYGEGKTFLDAIEVESDQSGNAHGTFPASALYMTATALVTECASPCPSSQLFNTSEFSKCVTTREPIVVNSTADDSLTGLTECKTSKGQCTLRAAIELANRDPGFDEITFDLPEGGEQVIRPQRSVPEILHPVEIDAAEITGDTCSPTVALQGSEQAKVGIRLKGKGSTLKGLAIYGFDNGVELNGEGEHRIECCYVGLNLAGEVYSARNQRTGISIFSDSNLVGGKLSKQRNIIAGNKYGIFVHRSKNRIQGNFIGTDASGSKPIPNEVGMYLFGDIREPELFALDNQIGGPTPVVGQPPGNVISGNKNFGIFLSNARAEIQGNVIGGDRLGKKRIANRTGIYGGLWIETLIGGDPLNERNLISGNEVGIYITSPKKDSKVSILGNLIGSDFSGVWPIGTKGKSGIAISSYGSSWADSTIKVGGAGRANKIAFNRTGIALGSDRVSALPLVEISQNSLFENVLGGIRGLSPVNSPNLYSAVLMSASGTPASNQANGAGLLDIRGKIVESFEGRIELFSNLFCHSTGLGEGERYLGSTEVHAGGDFTVQIDDPDLVGPFITATATRKATDEEKAATSSFSNCIPVSKFDPSEGKIDQMGVKASTGATITEAGKVDGSKPNKPQNLLVLNTLLQLGLSLEELSQSMALARQSTLGNALLTLDLPEGTRVDSYYNYGPTPDNTEPHWYEFLYDGSTGAEILEAQILLHFVDGQRGDHDLTVNGVIDTLGTPVLLGKTLYFPYNHVTDGSFVGFAVSNLSDEEAVLSYQAFDKEGSMPDSIHEDKILSLEPGHQLARLGTDIFDHDFGELDQELIDLIAEISEIDPSELKIEKDERSWVELTSSESEIGSFFQLGTWDLSQQDGSVAFEEQAKKLYFTRVYEGAIGYRGQPVSTNLSIANPNGETIELTLTLHPLAGGSSLIATRTIAAKGFLYESISELFGAGTEVAGGYLEVEVTEGEGAIGFELIQMENQDTVIGLNASFGNEASEAYSAQLASLSVLYTSVNLINTGSQSRQLTLTGINSDGTNLTSPVSVTLAPGEQYTRDAGEIFANGTQSLDIGPKAQSEFVGSLKVEADGPGVIGDVIFGESLQLDYAAALPLQTEPFTEAVFNQVANIPGVFFTGLAFYNPGSVAAAIDLQVVSADGTLVGEVTKAVEAGQRISPLVPELVPASQGQAGGYVLLKSDKPIIAQLLFGALRPNGTISLFSAVPPTVLK